MNEPTDDALRAAYARATSRPTERAACPDPAALAAVARREGPEDGRLATLDHVMACADCRREFELLRAIEQGGRAAGVAAVPMRARRAVRLGVGLAIAAGLGAVALLGPWREGRVGDPGPDVVRDATSGVAVVTPAEGATVAPGALALAWRPVPGARTYTVEVLGADGAVRLDRTTSDTLATLDAATLAPGDYRWWVRARLDGGERRSVPRRLRVGEVGPRR